MISDGTAVETLEALISDYERKIRSALITGAPGQREVHTYRLLVFNLYSALALLRPDNVSHPEPFTADHNTPA